MVCSICGYKADDDVVRATLEAKGNREIRVCELCACDIAIALFSSRTVSMKLEDGMFSLEVL